MNARILKKKCKQAVATLTQLYGYRSEDFVPVRECGESYGFSTRFAKKFPRHQRRNYGRQEYVYLARGTLVYNYRCSYEYDEWDWKPATEQLQTEEWFASLDDSDL